MLDISKLFEPVFQAFNNEQVMCCINAFMAYLHGPKTLLRFWGRAFGKLYFTVRTQGLGKQAQRTGPGYPEWFSWNESDNQTAEIPKPLGFWYKMCGFLSM